MTSTTTIFYLAGAALLLAVAVVWLSLRYLRYERRLARGRRKLKPVWKPFWMN